jgi:hypothetical protein
MVEISVQIEGVEIWEASDSGEEVIGLGYYQLQVTMHEQHKSIVFNLLDHP